MSSKKGALWEKNRPFETSLEYTDRKSKAQFVYEKYHSILEGPILDVGADEMHLKQHLPSSTEYRGIGFGNHPDLQSVNLEADRIPFDDNSFETVLCLDVLEHLENIHQVFDDLCRVSRNWVIISLPNPWASFFHCLETEKYRADRNIKFYGLTREPEADRHKWFFSASEAKNFVQYRAEKNHFTVHDLYVLGEGNTGENKARVRNKLFRSKKIKGARKLLFRHDLEWSDLYEGTMWWVLKRQSVNG